MMDEETKNTEASYEDGNACKKDVAESASADNDNNDNEEKNASKTLVNDILDIIESVISSIFVVLLIFTFLFKMAFVSGSSMESTLKDGDKLIISDLFYEPEYGDVVILNQSVGGHDYIIKRIIATQGQIVNIVFDEQGYGSVYVDGNLLTEDYINEPMQYGTNQTFTLGEGEIFVMGDNRNHSTDGRFFGPVSQEKIVGKVIFRYSPSVKFDF